MLCDAQYIKTMICWFWLEFGIYQHCVCRYSDTNWKTLKDWCLFTSQVKIFMWTQMHLAGHIPYLTETQTAVHSRYITVYYHEAITAENRPNLWPTTNNMSESPCGIKLSHLAPNIVVELTNWKTSKWEWLKWALTMKTDRAHMQVPNDRCQDACWVYQQVP